MKSTLMLELKRAESFTRGDSVVRKIWGNADTILFIFAGASAEFALNKAVDWLYFTGKLPADPLGRLFSTVAYARKIVFADTEGANASIDMIHHIHNQVEKARGYSIPAWAYRDVLYMLIDYSIRAYELLERRLSTNEKEEVFDVFRRVGARMQIPDLPETYNDWLTERAEHLRSDLASSEFTTDLYRQYRKHLGGLRFHILRDVQAKLVPQHVADLLKLQSSVSLPFLLTVYGWLKRVGIGHILRNVLLPKGYVAQVIALDEAT